VTELTDREWDELLRVADHAIVHGLHGQHWLPATTGYGDPLRAPGASFVTLERRGQLQGCIGTIQASQPLVVDVALRARAAAFDDLRFSGITWEDFRELTLKVSVLGPLVELTVEHREALLAALEPGVDGLLIQAAGYRATFLPAVWAKVADAEEFCTMLWQKAGLQPRAWPAGLQIWRYTSEERAADPETRTRQRTAPQ